MDYSEHIEKIQKLIDKSVDKIENFILVLVNTQFEETPNILSNSFWDQISVSDLSHEDLIEIETGFRMSSEYYRFYHSSAEFIGSLLLGELISDKDVLVYTTTHIDSSINGRSFLPTLTKKHGMKNLVGDPYSLAISKNKYDYFELIADEVPTPGSFSLKEANALFDKKTSTTYLIVKPALECCAKSVTIVSSKIELKDAVTNITKELQQHAVIQEFIDGLEVNVPILSCEDEYIPLPPTVIIPKNTKESILTEQIIRSKEYYYETPCSKTYPLDDEMITALHKSAVTIAKRLDLGGLSRIDFRINKEGVPIVFDIASIPYLTPYDSCSRSFHHLFPSDEYAMFKALIGSVL